ncbi:MAG: tetratricopeptide repeat protein [Lachnospiraceae bacterium]|nr:tetratricopeptide repeat protein [Lachnospiraceae bacterium]
MSDKVMETVEAVPETATKASEKTNSASGKRNNKKLYMIIGAAIVIIMAILIGVNIYNSPQRRLERLLDLGNTYLGNGQYEEAAITFEQAIAIDPRCVEAYAGGVEAYRNTNDTAGMTAFYNKALAAVDGLDEGLVTEKVDYIAQIYLAADDVYGFDQERVIETLEEGYRKTGENPRVRERLVIVYLDMANEGEYEERLEIIDKLLELDGDNEEIKEELDDLLTEYIGLLIEEGQYDKIEELTGRYDDTAREVIDQYVDEYIGRAQDLETAGSYEESMAIYDILLRLDEESDKVQAAVQDFLQGYIDILLQEGRYDEIRRLVDKYGDLVPGMDFDAILAQIEAMEAEAARIAEEEERARQAAVQREAAQNATTQGQQSQFSSDEIPLFIQYREMTVFRTGVPLTWSDAERAQYKAMWESLWGAGSWPMAD